MFAVERSDPAAAFRFVFLNDALEGAAPCNRWDIIGKTLAEVMPSDEGDAAARRFKHCIDTREVVRFADTFAFSPEHGLWDTTLQSAVLPDGRERVVATSIQQRTPAQPPKETVVLEDIQYFSSMADFQIQNLITMFETYQAKELFEDEAEQRIAKLSGMCRTVQRAVSDIKKSVRNAQCTHIPIDAEPLARPVFHRHTTMTRCGTLKALTDVSTERRTSG